MLKKSTKASAVMLTVSLTLCLSASIQLSADAANKKNKLQQLQEQIKANQAKQNGGLTPQQGQYDHGQNSSNSAGGAGGYGGDRGYDNAGGNSSSSGGSDSVAMFKAGNTSLPAGTYAVTNVSTGAAFVVIVDETGDMRAQDARAMNLIDDSKNKRTANRGSHSGSGAPRGSDSYSGNGYGGAGNYGGSGTSGSAGNMTGGSAAGYPANSPTVGVGKTLAPEPIPSSAVLPTPTSGHPLLQGGSQTGVYPSALPSGGASGLFGQANALMQGQSTTGQIPGGMKGVIQSELQRQLGKQLMKHGPNIERQVRKYMDKMN